MSLPERILQLVDVDDGARVSESASLFVRFLLVEAAVHGWVTTLDGTGRGFETALLVSAILLTGIALFAFRARPPRGLVVLAFATMAGRLIVAFPHIYNHLFLECVLMGAAAVFPNDEEDDKVFLQFVRATIVLVLFWSGLQKLLHGCYFGGEFLAVSIASNEYFAVPFSWIAPTEVERLQALLPLRMNAGPFRLESPVLVAAANGVWLAEIGLALALLVPRLRNYAVVAGLLLLVAIESAARELVFGLLFGSGLLLFAPGPLFRRTIPWLLGALGFVLLIEIFFPDVWLN